MENRILRWGLLSTAKINQALIGPLRSSPRNRLSAVASRNLEKAQEYAQQWEIARAYGSYEALIADPEVDVIYNSLPNALHAEWTIRAVRAGKHVLCEKPLAMSAQEVLAIQTEAQVAGVVVTEAFMYRHHPQTLQAKEMVSKGILGKPLLMKGSFAFRLDNQQDVRYQPELGGGSIWDVGCYPISYARLLSGSEPIDVFGWQNLTPGGVDGTFVGQLRFDSGLVAQIDCSFSTPLRTGFEVIGEQASLYLPVPFKPTFGTFIELRRGEDVERITVSGQELYQGEVEDMADAVLLGKNPRISLDDSLGNVRTITSLIESARKGIPIQMT